MKMLYTKCLQKQPQILRKSISTVVTKEPEKSYGLIHHWPKPLKLTLQSCSSDYWINISQSLTYYTKFLMETQSKLVIVVWKTYHKS